LSGYVSNDNFDYYKESAFNYRNFASTLKWKHTFSPKLYAQFSAVISNYNYQLNSIQDSTTYSSLNYRLDQKILRADFVYRPIDGHKIDFGLDAITYSLSPGVQKPVGFYSEIPRKLLKTSRLLNHHSISAMN